ncbi:MAG: RnfABCDGE type electron transport complex subunit A [Elusimicrobiota bacterium]
MSEISLFGIFMAALLINNMVLIRFLALCSFFGVSNDIEASIGMGMAVTFVMVMATSVSWIIYYGLLDPVTSVFGLSVNLVFLRTAVFILTIASLVQFVEMVMKKFFSSLYKALGIFLPLITTNCAILGVAFLSIDYKYSFIQSVVYALGASLGYTLVIVLFAGIRRQIALAPVPKSLQGYPIAFFTASLMSLAFLGFKGLFGL